MSDSLIVERDNGVVTLTLNRPDSLNSLDAELREALRDTLGELDTDPDCRAVLLTGAGRAFCVGQDLREHANILDSGTDDPLRAVREHYNPIAARLGACSRRGAPCRSSTGSMCASWIPRAPGQLRLGEGDRPITE